MACGRGLPGAVKFLSFCTGGTSYFNIYPVHCLVGTLSTLGDQHIETTLFVSQIKSYIQVSVVIGEDQNTGKQFFQYCFLITL